MNTKVSFLVAAICGASLLVTVGCGKQDSTAPSSTPPSPTAASGTTDVPKAMGTAAAQATQAVASVKQAADKAVTDTKQAAQQVAGEAQKTAAAGAAEATKLADTAIAKAKVLMGEKKYQEALTALQQAAALQLTPDQKKTLDGLMAEVQKLLATDPTKAVGGLLEPKK